MTEQSPVTYELLQLVAVRVRNHWYAARIINRDLAAGWFVAEYMTQNGDKRTAMILRDEQHRLAPLYEDVMAPLSLHERRYHAAAVADALAAGWHVYLQYAGGRIYVHEGMGLAYNYAALAEALDTSAICPKCGTLRPEDRDYCSPCEEADARADNDVALGELACYGTEHYEGEE